MNKDYQVRTSLAPWLTLKDCAKAIEFYKSAFDAVEIYRMESPEGGLVVNLTIDDAGFWVSNGSDIKEALESVGGDTVRMILTVAHPEAIFEKAIRAGATEIFPIGEEYGWKLGRIVDPFGLHWEIGHPLHSEV